MDPFVWLPVLLLLWVVGTLVVHWLLRAWYARTLQRGMRSGSTQESPGWPEPDGAVSVTLVPLSSEIDSPLVGRLRKSRTRRVTCHLLAGCFLAFLLAWLILTVIDPIGFSVARASALALLLGVAALAQTLVLSLSGRGQLSSAGVWSLSATAGFLLAMVHVVAVAAAPALAGNGGIPLTAGLLLVQEVIAIVVVAVLFWLLLQAREGARRLLGFGPEALAVSTAWVLVALITTVIWSKGQHGERAWLLLLPLLGYVGLLRALFAAWTRSSGTPIPVLYLRTFGPGHRGEWFLRAFSRWWSGLGPVRLITGEDTASSTLSSAAALALLSGRLKRLFVASPAVAAASVERLAAQSTADGTFPVTELFCTATTWRPVVQELMRAVAVVIIDLRAYRPAHQGVAFEVHALAREVDPERIIHVVDQDTDIPAVEALLRREWSHRAEPVVLSVYELPEPTGRGIEGLVTHASRVARKDRIQRSARQPLSTVAMF